MVNYAAQETPYGAAYEDAKPNHELHTRYYTISFFFSPT